MTRPAARLFGALTAACLALGATSFASADTPIDSGPTPRAVCGPGSIPETGTQGRVSAADIASGRAAKGYLCNTELVGHFGTSGGYKVLRYVDKAGHECAYYDSTLLFPSQAIRATTNLTGVYVLDMKDPAHPAKTANLLTPAMQSPHESLLLNQKRGLLVADMGYPTFNPGFVDVYDVTQDCRQPVLRSSMPTGIVGHESGFSPDGMTFYVSSAALKTLTAIDLTNPAMPMPLWEGKDWRIHGLNVSDDGTRVYAADLGDAGLTILDVSQVQQRVMNPDVKVVSHLTWPEVSIPQVPIPVTIKGHPYLVEIDEFAKGVFGYNASDPVGAARIIDIADDTKPRVVSNIRLEVNQAKNRAGEQQNDPGATNGLQGYAGHYCAVPQRAEPGIVACSFILSGLRVFDIRDPLHPKEMAYYNKPTGTGLGSAPTSYDMSASAFVPERSEIWFADGNSGFYAIRLTNGVWPFRDAPASVVAPTPTVAGATVRRAALPATGGRLLLAAGVLLLAAAFTLRRLARAA